MDLADFDLKGNAEAGFEFTLYNPYTGEDTEIKISVVGSDSKAYRQAKAEAMRESIKGGVVDTDAVSAKVYAKCITGWSGFAENGKDLPFNPDTAEDILNRYPWVMDQVAAKVDNRLNFTKPPKKK